MAEADNTPATPPQNTQPGQVISPGGAENPVPPAPPAPLPQAAPSPPPNTTPEPSTPFAPQSELDPLAQDPYATNANAIPETDEITWTASEFVAHEKSARWYLLLAGAALLLAAVIYLLTRDAISSTVVIVGALFLGVYGSRQPRQLEYRLSSQGITIGQKHYSYDEFRSFSVAQEGAFSSIIFMPLKRFSPPITIYYAVDNEEEIASILAAQLPMQEHTDDVVDRLTRRMRF